MPAQHDDIGTITGAWILPRRDPTWEEQQRALWAMTRRERVEAMRAGRLTTRQCLHWASQRPHEVPLLNGEYWFIAVTTPEVCDDLDDPDADVDADGAAAGVGTIYLLHFQRPYRHARHYLGWTSDLDARLEAHRAGRGSPLVAAAAAAGIPFRLVRTWPGDRQRERRLHRHKNSPARLCPICRAEGREPAR